MDQSNNNTLPDVDVNVVAETTNLRVVRVTIAVGASIPWHHHSYVDDRYFCTEGEMTVDTREPQATHRLCPGSELTVPAKTVHLVTNIGAERCRFVLVQGMGTYDRVMDRTAAP